jgi:prophage regulatory protein
LTNGDRLLRRVEVERRVGLGRSALYRMMRSGAFPEPVRISPKAVRWPASEIEAWMASLPRSHGDGIDRRAGKGQKHVH